jgi:hypothetical protein
LTDGGPRIENMHYANLRVKLLGQHRSKSKSSVGRCSEINGHQEPMPFGPVSPDRSICETSRLNRKNRTTSFPQDRFRDATQPESIPTSPPMRPYGDEIRPDPPGDVQDSVFRNIYDKPVLRRDPIVLGKTSHTAQFEQTSGLQRT